MKILMIGFFSQEGGAAIAMQRLSFALRASGVNIELACARGNSANCELLFGPLRKIINRVVNGLLWRLSGVLRCETLSLNACPSGVHNFINNSDADVVHLHWINAEMISIRELAMINRPVVWTLHDMWAFCGAEHYTTAERYSIVAKPEALRNAIEPCAHIQGRRYSLKWCRSFVLDILNIWTFRRKEKSWKNWRGAIVTPSNWLGETCKQSALLSKWPVYIIHNCIDLEMYRPIEKTDARRRLGLPLNKRLILCGSASISDRRKGVDILVQSLEFVNPDAEVVVLGGAIDVACKQRFHSMGYINDDDVKSCLYSAVDVFVLPSRADNLPNMAVESIACGTPVVAFNVGGIPDIVEHKQNGYLAVPFDCQDLARGINWVLNSRDKHPASNSEQCGADISYPQLSHNSRTKAERSFSPQTVAKQYIDVYLNALSG